MSVNAIKLNERTIQINVGERFDYSMHKAFRDAYSQYSDAGLTYKVNLSKSSHMDSSALGMILLLKEHAEKQGGQLILQRPSDTVLKILKIANFDKLVKIE